MMKILKIILIFYLIPSLSFATNYYVDGDMLNDTGDGSIGSPKKYISTGIALLSSADTLTIADGTYTGAVNMIGADSTGQEHPPSGTAENYTVITAENIGGVVINGEYLRSPISNAEQAEIDYVRISGIHFKNSIDGMNVYGDYNKITNCGFENGIADDDDSEVAIFWIAGGSSYTLVEDSWAWGRGRYGFYTSSPNGGTDHIIFRRLVVRLDDTPVGYVSSGIRFYNGDTNIVQNSIVIYSTPNVSSINQGAFAIGGGSSTGDNNHTITGCIALNNTQWYGVFPENIEGILTVKASVFWGNDGQGVGAVASSDDSDPGNIAINCSNVTSGDNGMSGFRSYLTYDLIENVTNSISVNNTEYGIDTFDTASYINTYNNTSGASIGTTITNGIATNPVGSSLKYLTRIEDDSTLDGAASDSGDIGATVLKQIGVTGTLYGETGYNTTTDSDLWPWPTESVWQPKLASASARGFCASGVTLTSYIWEYLGNDIPDSIYGTTSTTITTGTQTTISTGTATTIK